MKAGLYISGIGHLALIGWILFGGMFQRFEEPTFQAADVSILTEEEFAALSQPTPVEAPETAVDVTPPEAPAEDAAPVMPAADEAPETPDTPEAEAPMPPQEAPDISEADPLPQPQVDPDAPVTPAPPSQEGTTIVTEVAPRPAPRASDRVAPVPVAPSEPDTEIAETLQDAVQPDENGETVEEEQEATAPEEATTRIVTEHEQEETAEVASFAPVSSRRPPARPARPARRVETPRETPAPNPLADVINDAVEEANANAASTRPAPAGPPLSRGEKDALRLAVQQCWNVGSLSSEALRTTVVVAVSMGRDGRPDSGSIRMLNATGGSDGAARQAYEAARRAILRCGARGYNLPTDKYNQWQEIEITFNPERMRIK